MEVMEFSFFSFFLFFGRVELMEFDEEGFSKGIMGLLEWIGFSFFP